MQLQRWDNGFITALAPPRATTVLARFRKERGQRRKSNRDVRRPEEKRMRGTENAGAASPSVTIAVRYDEDLRAQIADGSEDPLGWIDAIEAGQQSLVGGAGEKGMKEYLTSWFGGLLQALAACHRGNQPGPGVRVGRIQRPSGRRRPTPRTVPAVMRVPGHAPAISAGSAASQPALEGRRCQRLGSIRDTDYRRRRRRY